MGITLDKKVAREKFQNAIELAEAEGQLPADWIEATETMAKAQNKTFVAMLGTALLAKATNPQIDPLALQSSAPPRGELQSYSARGLATDVLVPCSVQYGVHLGVTGREPLNNQPFFGKSRVQKDLKVKGAAIPELSDLVDYLERIVPLTQDQALKALAAFLRSRRKKIIELQEHLLLSEGNRTVRDLMNTIQSFTLENSEGGKRGQALAAAALELIFPHVNTSRVNDPGRHWPGDVQAFWNPNDAPLTVVEVKQKPVRDTDIYLFAQKVSEAQIPRALYVALAPQDALNKAIIRKTTFDNYGVHMSIEDSTESFLGNVFTWSNKPLDVQLKELPNLFLNRLRDIEVSQEGLQQWLDAMKV